MTRLLIHRTGDRDLDSGVVPMAVGVRALPVDLFIFRQTEGGVPEHDPPLLTLAPQKVGSGHPFFPQPSQT